MKRKQLVLLAILFFSLTSCSTVDKIKNKINPGADKSSSTHSLAATSARNSEIHVKLNGVGKATDGWFEYKLVVSNPGKDVIADLKGYVLDREGREYDAATDPVMLNEPPKLAEGLLITTAAATGGMALALAGIPFAGPILMAGVLLYESNELDSSLSNDLNFIRSSMVGSAVHINDEKKGSFFFPAINAEKLKITYLIGNARKSILLDPGVNTASQISTANNASPYSAEESKSRINKSPLSQSASISSNGASRSTISSEPVVLEAQKRLRSLGYNPGMPDGLLGNRTVAALQQFQQDNGLTITGRLDADTAAFLKQRGNQ